MDDANNAPSNVVINGNEYTPEEAQELIETGRKTREYEKNYNTKLDNVWPEYGKLSQEKSTWMSEKEKYESQLKEFQTKQQQQVETPADVRAAREAAKKLGIVLDEDASKFMTEDKLEQWYTSRRERERAEEEGVRSVLNEADRIAAEVKESGAPVAFNKKAVLAYASAYGLTDLKQAYEEMNADVLNPWKESQIEASKGSSLKTLGSGGKKTPSEPRVTSDNAKEMLREVLHRPTNI